MTSNVDTGPNLLMSWGEPVGAARVLRAGIGSVAIHVALFFIAIALASLQTPAPKSATEIVSNLQHVTLIAPPMQLTQKAPNRSKLTREVNVEDLMPRPPSQQHLAPAPAIRTFKPPVPQPPPGPQPTPRMAEPPKIEASNTPPATVPPTGVPKAPPPPQIQPEEKPKLAFETPGQHTTNPNPTLSKVPKPNTTVADSVRSVVHGGGQPNVVVGDIEPPPNIQDSLHVPPLPGRTGSQLELKSDPMGVDFKPYLIRVLTLVRANWFAVIPESAHLGTRGVAVIQFIIDRSGQVPKLVIAAPSGTEALDRAAVAGISASVPFPPLPAEFKGREIRVEFSFKYNVR